MGVMINLTKITKNHAADPEMGFFTKKRFKVVWRATAIPPAWELRCIRLNHGLLVDPQKSHLLVTLGAIFLKIIGLYLKCPENFGPCFFK